MTRRSQARRVGCADVKAFSQPYVDGELAAPEREAWERHIEGCESCRNGTHFEARFKAALRGHLPRRRLSADFEEQIRSSLAHEPRVARWRPDGGRTTATASSGVLLGRWATWFTWPRLLPTMAVAGAVAVAMWAGAPQRPSFVLDQARRSYQAELPLDVIGPDCSSVTSWFRGRVDFPVHAPRMPTHVKCQGGRLVNVADRPAAYLVYQEPSGHRVAVLVFDAESSPIDAPYRRVVEGHEVFYRNGPGISTAAFQARGLGYVVTSDLDEDSLTRLVSANFQQ